MPRYRKSKVFVAITVILLFILSSCGTASEQITVSNETASSAEIGVAEILSGTSEKAQTADAALEKEQETAPDTEKTNSETEHDDTVVEDAKQGETETADAESTSVITEDEKSESNASKSTPTEQEKIFQNDILSIYRLRKKYYWHNTLAVDNYFDLVVLNGNTASVTAINERYKSICESSLTDDHLLLGYEKSKADNSNWEPWQPLYDRDEVTLQYHDANIISFSHYYDSYLGGATDVFQYYGETYDLRTGNLLKLTDLISGGEEAIRDAVLDRVNQYINSNSPEAGKSGPYYSDYALDDFRFYLSKTGEVVICFDKYGSVSRLTEIPIGLHLWDSIEDRVEAVPNQDVTHNEQISDNEKKQMRDAIFFYIMNADDWCIYDTYGYTPDSSVREQIEYDCEIYRIDGNPSFDDIKTNFFEKASKYMTSEMVQSLMDRIDENVRIIDGVSYYLEGLLGGNGYFDDDSFEYLYENGSYIVNLTGKVDFGPNEIISWPYMNFRFVNRDGKLLISSAENA